MSKKEVHFCFVTEKSPDDNIKDKLNNDNSAENEQGKKKMLVMNLKLASLNENCNIFH